LYHFIDQTAREIYGEPVLIYRFWPHGSKNINDLCKFNNFELVTRITIPIIWCHDQEPLDHQLYKKDNNTATDYQISDLDKKAIERLKILGLHTPKINLNYVYNAFNKNILLHSEKRSTQVDKYVQDGQLVPVYYWNHAMIARDWYRAAEHISITKLPQTKKFLVYMRAWTGTREYRIKFAELLHKNNLIDKCLTSFTPVDLDTKTHYLDHVFVNEQWRSALDIEDCFDRNTAPSDASADFVDIDYASTDIEVVLETLFDDTRLHLTEKVLRPIACAQPFILASTHGSLQYLQEYGFRTFDGIWDESYDLIEDPVQRLQAILALMKQINEWSPETRQQKLLQAQAVADHNRTWFFSQEFSALVLHELCKNLQLGFAGMYRAGLNYNFIEHFNKLPLGTDEIITDWYANFGLHKNNYKIFFEQLANRIKLLEQKICSQPKKHV
jgi:hypothetical protein